jgi:hypothetical protein
LIFVKSSLLFIIPIVAEEDHCDADCLLMTVLTHGESSKFLHAHDSLYNVEDLWLPFTADKCQSLGGKPKVFVIQVSEYIFMVLIV